MVLSEPSEQELLSEETFEKSTSGNFARIDIPGRRVAGLLSS